MLNKKIFYMHKQEIKIVLLNYSLEKLKNDF